jgi:hypothetical protein
LKKTKGVQTNKNKQNNTGRTKKINKGKREMETKPKKTIKMWTAIGAVLGYIGGGWIGNALMLIHDQQTDMILFQFISAITLAVLVHQGSKEVGGGAPAWLFKSKKKNKNIIKENHSID